MTKLLRIIESANLRGGGPIEGTRRFGEVWARCGHQQDIVTLDPPSEQHLENYPGKIINLGTPRGWRPTQKYRYSPMLVPWLEKNAAQYDAVIVSGLWRYMARAAHQALANGPIPYFVFTHGMLDPWFRRAMPFKHIGKQLSWFWAEGPLLRDAASVFFTTGEEKLLAENAFWPYCLSGEVVGYGTSDIGGDPISQEEIFRKNIPSLGNRSFLLFLSRIHPKKGCDLLVEAFGRIAADHSDLDLVIAGPDQVGLVAQLREQADEIGIGHRVHFPGMLTGDAKAGAFRACTAFILPSHQENFGIVVAEAMACAAPVLLSDKVNIWREVVADGAGFAAPDDREGIHSLLKRFLQLSVKDRQIMARIARATFLRRFHVDKAAENLMQLIETKIKHRRIRA